MTTDELLLEFRSVADDPELPGNGDASDSLWSDEEILRYMNMAQRAFAKYTEIFRDSSTAEICNIAVTADNPIIDIDPRIIKIKRATLNSTKRKLRLVEHQWMDEGYSDDDYGVYFTGNWEDKKGTPKIVLMNWEKDKARITPISTVGDQINLTVVRYPLIDIVEDTDPLEVTQTEHQYIMLDAMQYYAYKKHDADIYDEQKANGFLASFKTLAQDVKTELNMKYKPMRNVQYGGI